jgi:drug/metabolite transporter (DMT)-like permease
MKNRTHIKGVAAGLVSAVLLGSAPIFAKLAMSGGEGFSPFFIVMFRSIAASLLMFIFIVVFRRKFLYIYPLGLVGCVLAGILNGIGSILYYTALARMDASIGQLIYSSYPLFVAFWLLLDRQPLRWMTIVRLMICLPGIYLLLVVGRNSSIDLIGVLLMFGAAILYALHLIINQRILYDAPAPTVTFYTLLSMSLVVTTAFLLFDRHIPAAHLNWWPVLAMAAILFLSRLTLFLGVKHLGGLQTAILGLGELLTTVIMATIWLGENLTVWQWIGGGLLALSLFLVGFDKPTSLKRPAKGILSWLTPPQVEPGDIDWNS